VKHTLNICAAALFFGVLAFATGHPASADDGEKAYTLRYRFHPGETLRWEVERRTNLRVTVGESTQATETSTLSLKAWRVSEVASDGTATFEHRVEWVDMRQQHPDCAEVRYDSRTDAKPPAGFDDVAQATGVPLATVTLDARGKVLHRERQNVKAAAKNEDGCITIPLPDEPVSVGYTWSCPQDIDIPLETGGIKKIKANQRFTIESIQTGVATIRVATDVITPINDPAIEAKLVQRESSGRVRFDIDAGRIIGQQMDIDKHVVGFRGESSSLRYVDRFTERFVPSDAVTAAKTAVVK
jgi:hypothetical protein